MRKRSGKPGASHLIAQQNAHGKGDFETARRAALAYAKECTAHCKAEHEGQSHEMAEAKAAPKAPDRRAQLARLAASRSKKQA